MNPHPPPPPLRPLQYAPPPPAQKNYGQFFNALLIGLGLLCILVLGQFIIMGRAGTLPNDSWVFTYLIFIHALYLASIIVALLVRWFVPSMNRTITIAVSIFLLLFFPFGTVVGIYGLKKLDRQT
jgi:hypothetical protein